MGGQVWIWSKHGDCSHPVPAVCSPVEKLCFAVGRSGTLEGCMIPGVDIFSPRTNEQTLHIAGGTRNDGITVALRFK